MILIVEIILLLIFLAHLYRFIQGFKLSRSRELWPNAAQRRSSLFTLFLLSAVFFPLIFFTLRLLAKGMTAIPGLEKAYGIEPIAFFIPAMILAIGWADGSQAILLKRMRGLHTAKRLMNRPLAYLLLLLGLALSFFQLHWRFGYDQKGIQISDIWGRWDLYSYSEVTGLNTDEAGYYRLTFSDDRVLKFQNYAIKDPQGLAAVFNDRIGVGPAYGLVIHGGAGSLTPENVPAEVEAAYAASLRKALNTGWEMLERGYDALDVVEAVIIRLENDTLFNAGRGAVLTAEGRVELDASIMDGHQRRAGCVSGVRNTKNPIRLARMVMERSPHVFHYGAGADELAKQWELPMVENDYFITKRWANKYAQLKKEYGTVGVTVLDKKGNLAAGTSTGGMMMKAHGRIGDSPIIGAGTYADNNSCAVSCTGHGEYFIRATAARDVAAQMEYGNKQLNEAAEFVITSRVGEAGGIGGLIAIDKKGNVALPFNTESMLRAAKTSRGLEVVAVFGEE